MSNGKKVTNTTMRGKKPSKYIISGTECGITDDLSNGLDFPPQNLEGVPLEPLYNTIEAGNCVEIPYDETMIKRGKISKGNKADKEKQKPAGEEYGA